jgi:hypothetical protein
MSPSTRSKAKSQSSPATGAAAKTDVADDRSEAEDAKPSKAEVKERRPGLLEIELEVSRQRTIGWTVFGIVFGSLLIWKLGTVGVWVGFVLVAIGLLRAWQLAQTFMHPPGTIVVTDHEVTLPRGLCLPRPLKVPPSDVTAVYFLRRSVPWNRSAPVLVIELGAKAMAFPRDWFASEADQRHIVHALMKHREGMASSDDKAAAAEAPAPNADDADGKDAGKDPGKDKDKDKSA